MKKLLFFIESLSSGGAEKVLSDIVARLNKEKFDVTVVTVTDEGTYQKKVEEHCHYRTLVKQADWQAGGLRKLVYRVKIHLIYLLPAFVVYRCIFRERYDIEVAFVEGYATKLIAASNNPHSKKLAWVHIDVNNNPYADRHYRSLEEQRLTYERYNRIVCVSQSVKDAMISKFPGLKNLCVAYNPVDCNNIKSLSKAPTELGSSDGMRFVTVGRLEHQKGYARLIRICEKLKEESFSFRLYILGDGTQREYLEKLIEDYQLGEYVILEGFQRNPYRFVKACDAFVCSSYAEGFSTAATEALILGKPVFTVECSGMKELIGDSKAGIITDNTDDALFLLLRSILSGDIPLEEYAAAARKRGLEFDIYARMAEIEDLLDG